MNEALRRGAAHAIVADVAAPVLPDSTAHHLHRVLRLRDGETVTVTDGAGRWRECRVVGASIEPAGEVVAEPPVTPLAVLVAIPKQDRPEWLVQKATELGIDRITFLHAERSVVHWSGDRAERHLERLRKVAAEAAMQARRVWLPEVTGPLDALAALPSAAVAEPGGRPLARSDHTVAIGPEGGWTERELNAARDRIGLGATVLRVETAALAACTLMCHARC